MIYCDIDISFFKEIHQDGSPQGPSGLDDPHGHYILHASKLPSITITPFVQTLTPYLHQLSTSDSAQVSCFSSHVRAPITEIYSVIKDFCANTFPKAYTPNLIIFGRTFDLPSGGWVKLEVNLDPAVVRLTAGDCVLDLGMAVAACAADGASTGGVYSPIGTGDSKFKVQVYAPEGSNSSPAEVASPDDCANESSTSTISKRNGPTCWVKAAPAPKPTVPMLWAAQAVHDWCTSMDGKIMYKDQEFDNLVNWVVPNIFVSIDAFRTVSIFKDGCMRAFDPLLRTCSDGEWSFSGGYVSDALAEYSIDIRDPVDDTSKRTDSALVDSGVAARSSSNEPADAFNATESTNGHFTTACDSDAGSGGLSVDQVKAQGAANYMCLTFNGKAIAKGDQIPALFEDPAQFANIIALDTFTVTTADCDWAYDTLFKACARDGRYYGGSVTFGPGKYVLDIPPGGLTSVPAISVRDLTLTTHDSALAARSSEDGVCQENGITVDKIYALTAAWDTCVNVGSDDWSVNDGATHLYTDTLPWISARIVATETMSINFGKCMVAFAALLESCSSDSDVFCGGTIESEGAKFTLIAVPDLKRAAETIDASADAALQSRSDSADPVIDHLTCDSLGTYWVQWDQAFNAGIQLCSVLDNTPLTAGFDYLNVYQEGLTWVYTSLTTPDEDTSIDYTSCAKIFLAATQGCRPQIGDHTSGGSIDSGNFAFKYWTGDVNTTAPSGLRVRSADTDSSNDGSIQCQYHDDDWVQWDRPLNAGVQLCSALDRKPLKAGIAYTAVYPEGRTSVWPQLTPASDTSIDYKSCVEKLFWPLIFGCRARTGDRTSGGSIQRDGFSVEYRVGDLHDGSIADSTHTELVDTAHASIPRRQSNDPYHGGHVQCHSNGGLSVAWEQAFSATIEFCRSLDGAVLTERLPSVNTYQEGMYWIWTQFTPLLAMTVDYQTCIELFDATIRNCRNGEQTSGGMIEWGEYTAQYDVHIANNANVSTTEAADTSGVARRQNNDCLRAESTPVNKEVPRLAIGVFCKEYDGRFLASNKGLNATWSNSGVDSSMYITVTAAQGYVLHTEQCVSEFEKLMTDCGDGAADASTNGGTLVGVDASFSLILVSI